MINIQPLTIIFLLLFSSTAIGQVFWTENFNNGCTSSCPATAYNGPNGIWTVTNTGVNGADANVWYVSCAENGHTNNVCGSGCVSASATATLASLHVGSAATSMGDVGASYDMGGLCGFWTCPQTNKRVESPVINCTGKSAITLSFNYIENGSGAIDDATLWYNAGAGWIQLVNLPKTLVNCAGGQGRWTAYSIALPASCNNNPNVRIGFNWTNNDDGVGTDPSFAVDDIQLNSTAPFAVAITSVKAYTKGTGNQVEWSNATETETQHYEVQRSKDGSVFEVVQITPAKGNNNQLAAYTWYDALPHAGDNYYRIRAKGNNGESKLSTIVKVSRRNGAAEMHAFPNPVSGGEFTVQLSNLAKGDYTLTLYNAFGQQVFVRDIQHAGGSASQVISLQKLAAGMYRLQLKGSSVNLQQTVIITNN